LLTELEIAEKIIEGGEKWKQSMWKKLFVLSKNPNVGRGELVVENQSLPFLFLYKMEMIFSGIYLIHRGFLLFLGLIYQEYL
jgi:hypothetical protein